MARSKYINTFNTTAEYNNYIESALPAFPNVGYDKEADKVNIVRTSPNDHVWYGEVVDPSHAVPTISLNGTTNTPTFDEFMNTFYLDSWSNAVPTSISFGNKSNIKSIKKLKGLDTSKVTSMRNMFLGCSSLTSLDLSNFDTSKVTDFTSMFDGCSKLTSLDLSNFNTSNTTQIGYMFYDCSKLTSVDISSFDTSKVTYISFMFNGCSSLTSLDLSNFNTSNVEQALGMFEKCSSLTSLDLSNWNTSSLIEHSRMFNGCSKLTDVYITVESTLNKLTNNLASQGSSYIPSSATIHYNGTDYKWTGSAWTPQS